MVMLLRERARPAMIREHPFAPWLADFLHELTVFPNGRHDDQVGSTAQAIAWTKQRSSTTGMLEKRRVRTEIRGGNGSPL